MELLNAEPRTLAGDGSGDRLVGFRSRLIPLLPMHYRPLYEITLEPEVTRTWEPSYQGGSFEAWSRRLWEGVLCQYGVQRRDLDSGNGANRSIDGLARCYGASMRHGTARVAVFASQRTHNAGLAMEATLLLIDFLFHEYPLRKLYVEALEYNYVKFADAVGRYFDVEAILREHEIHAGVAWDSYLLAVSREKWMEYGARAAETCRARGRRAVPTGRSQLPR